MGLSTAQDCMPPASADFCGAMDPISSFFMRAHGVSVDEAIFYAALGAVFQGYSMSVAFVQAWKYFKTYRLNDQLLFTIIMVALTVLCVASIIVGNIMFFHVLNYRNHYKDAFWLDQSLITVNLELLITTQTCMTVFFAYRAFVLHNRNIAVAIVTGSMTIAAFVYPFRIALMNSTDIPKWDPNVLTPQDLKWLIPQGIAFGAWIRPYIKAVSIVTLTNDAVITGLILWGLLKSRTGFKTTDTIIARLTFLMTESMPPLALYIVWACLSWTGTGISGPVKTITNTQPALYLWAVGYSLNCRETVRNIIASSMAQQNSQPSSGSDSKSIGIRSKIISRLSRQDIPKSKPAVHSFHDEDDQGEWHVLNNVSQRDLINSKAPGVMVTREQEQVVDQRRDDDVSIKFDPYKGAFGHLKVEA